MSEMLKELRKNSFKSSVGKFIITVFIILLSGFVVIDSTAYLKGGTKDLNSLTEEDLGNYFVSGTIYGIIDKFAAKDTTYNYILTKRNGDYVIIPYGEESYIAMYLPQKYADKEEVLIKETSDYLTKASNSIEGDFSVKGSLDHMTNEELEYYKKYTDIYDNDTQKLFLPYILRVDMIGSISYSYLAAIVAILIASIIWLIAIITNLIMGNDYKKPIRKYSNSKPEPALAIKELEQAYAEGIKINKKINIRFNDQIILIFQKKLCIIPKEQFIWAYIINAKGKNGIVSKIIFKTKEGQSYKIITNDNIVTEFIINKLKNFYPEVIFGYTADLDKLYKTDRASFIELAQNQHKEKIEENEGASL